MKINKRGDGRDEHRKYDNGLRRSCDAFCAASDRLSAHREENIDTEKETEKVQNIATIYEGTTEEEVPSPETKVANIIANKTSKIIYNEEKPHEHIIENGKVYINGEELQEDYLQPFVN